METHVLKTGESLTVNGEVKVLRCGMSRQGGGSPEPTVYLEVTEGATVNAEDSATTDEQSEKTE